MLVALPGWVLLVLGTIAILSIGLVMRVPVASRGDNDIVPYFSAAIQLTVSVLLSIGLWVAYFGASWFAN